MAVMVAHHLQTVLLMMEALAQPVLEVAEAEVAEAVTPMQIEDQQAEVAVLAS
jgi:hypothetical protein